jgi:hypothetical protein
MRFRRKSVRGTPQQPLVATSGERFLFDAAVEVGVGAFHQLTANEVLLDGQPWPSGEGIVAHLTPPTTSDLISARLFALLIPR